MLGRSPMTWFQLGLTIVDSIDTLILAGLEEEYQEVRGRAFDKHLALQWAVAALILWDSVSLLSRALYALLESWWSVFTGLPSRWARASYFRTAVLQ